MLRKIGMRIHSIPIGAADLEIVWRITLLTMSCKRTRLAMNCASKTKILQEQNYKKRKENDRMEAIKSIVCEMISKLNSNRKR